jgi:hypothetical protein
MGGRRREVLDRDCLGRENVRSDGARWEAVGKDHTRKIGSVAEPSAADRTLG